ncbi:MAG: HAMP domain-containing histidine kinase, partial [Chloroflexi bacterium]
MRATPIDPKREGRPVVLVRLQQVAKLRRHYIAQIPRWRQPLIGYFLSFPFVAIALILTLLLKMTLTHFYFPGALMLLTIVLVAFIWGVGPALLSVFLSTLALDYFFIPSSEQLSLQSWDGVAQILPFFLIGIIVAIISGQREAARRRALFAELALKERADELEETNQELKEVNQVKDQFISMASHELKTPITTIRGQAEVTLRRLSRQKELPEELAGVSHALEQIDEQTLRLNALVDDLLDLSSIRAGKMKLRLSNFDLREVCQSAVEEQRLLTGRNIELEQPGTPVMLNVDSERLSQVVTNLVNNAVKYSPETSPIKVSMEMQEKTIRLVVQDYGQGISKEQQTLIFET